MKARQVFAKNSVDGRRSLEPSEHLFLITDDGRLFERFSDDEPGVWSEIPLPNSDEQTESEHQKR